LWMQKEEQRNGTGGFLQVVVSGHEALHYSGARIWAKDVMSGLRPGGAEG
jgi:hypothetical protein